jgi:hypothetical protein
VGLGIDRRRHRRRRNLGCRPGPATSQRQRGERRDGRPGSVGRWAAAARRAASSVRRSRPKRGRGSACLAQAR